MHYDVTEDELAAEFKIISGFKSVKISWDKHDRSTGEAFVEFTDAKSFASARLLKCKFLPHFISLVTL